MDEGQWEACTSTTNPVESINRESLPKDGWQKSLCEALTHLYRIDKIYAAKNVAVSKTFPLLTETSHPPVKRKGGRRRGIGGVDVKLQRQMTILRVCVVSLEMWSRGNDKYYYYSLKISPRFSLVKTTRIIHHNQLLLTKYLNRKPGGKFVLPLVSVKTKSEVAKLL